MNNYEEWKKYLGDIWIDISKITHHISDSLFSALYNESINPDEIKCFAAPQTPPEAVLEYLWLNVKYFEWKKILDLWWGFGGMPFLLEKYVNQYIVCDPCFVDSIKESALQRTLKFQESSVAWSKKEFDFSNRELSIFDFDQWNREFEYHKLQQKNYNVLSLLKNSTSVLNYLNIWKDFNPMEHPKIIINSSKWEDIQWVETNSQDIVLICHILNKNYLNYFWILAEASRILKSDWEIFIVEVAKDEMRNILIKIWLKWVEKSWKIICKVKKTS